MKSVLLYLVLVGVPLLGLLGILRAGERLDAPPAVGGAWAMDDAFVQAVQGSCAPLDFPELPPVLTISQSGRYLHLDVNDAAGTSFAGRVRTAEITAHGALPGGAVVRPPCDAARPAALRLRLTESGGADRLTGEWTLPGCASCPPLPFGATRAASQ